MPPGIVDNLVLARVPDDGPSDRLCRTSGKRQLLADEFLGGVGRGLRSDAFLRNLDLRGPENRIQEKLAKRRVIQIHKIMQPGEGECSTAIVALECPGDRM